MKTTIVSLLIAGVLAVPTSGNAQIDNQGNGNEENSLGSGHSPMDYQSGIEEKSLDLDHESRQPTEVPFDGGATAMLIAGVAYGVKKAAQRAKNKKTVSKES